jgi:hypothetical protein
MARLQTELYQPEACTATAMALPVVLIRLIIRDAIERIRQEKGLQLVLDDIRQAPHKMRYRPVLAGVRQYAEDDAMPSELDWDPEPVFTPWSAWAALAVYNAEAEEFPTHWDQTSLEPFVSTTTTLTHRRPMVVCTDANRGGSELINSEFYQHRAVRERARNMWS